MRTMNDNVRFDGATTDTGRTILWFTDLETGGSFTVTPEIGETFEAKLAATRARFQPIKPVFGIQAYTPKMTFVERIRMAIADMFRDAVRRAKAKIGVKLTTLK